MIGDKVKTVMVTLSGIQVVMEAVIVNTKEVTRVIQGGRIITIEQAVSLFSILHSKKVFLVMRANLGIL